MENGKWQKEEDLFTFAIFHFPSRASARAWFVCDPRRATGGGEGAEEADGGAVEGGIGAADGGVRQVLARALRGFEGADDVLLRPGSPAADLAGIDPRGAQRRIVAAEMPHGGGVQARVVLLNRPAVERLIVHGAAAQLEGDGVAIPSAVAADLIGIQPRGGEGAIPAAEEARLEAGERRLAQLVATTGHRRPVQVLALSPRLLDEADDVLLGPPRPAGDRGVIDVRRFDRGAVRTEMIRRRRNQRLLAFGQRVVGQVGPGTVQPSQLGLDARLVPNHGGGLSWRRLSYCI